MRNIFTLLIFLMSINISNIFAQSQFQKVYGNDADQVGGWIQQTSDSGYIMTGQNGFGTTGDAYLLRLKSNGDTIWKRRYGGLSVDDGEYVQQTFDGGFVLAGLTDSYGAGGDDVFVVKTDTAGNISFI